MKMTSSGKSALRVREEHYEVMRSNQGRRKDKQSTKNIHTFWGLSVSLARDLREIKIPLGIPAGPPAGPADHALGPPSVRPPPPLPAIPVEAIPADAAADGRPSAEILQANGAGGRGRAIAGCGGSASEAAEEEGGGEGAGVGGGGEDAGEEGRAEEKGAGEAEAEDAEDDEEDVLAGDEGVRAGAPRPWARQGYSVYIAGRPQYVERPAGTLQQEQPLPQGAPGARARPPRLIVVRGGRLVVRSHRRFHPTALFLPFLGFFYSAGER